MKAVENLLCIFINPSFILRRHSIHVFVAIWSHFFLSTFPPIFPSSIHPTCLMHLSIQWIHCQKFKKVYLCLFLQSNQSVWSICKDKWIHCQTIKIKMSTHVSFFSPSNLSDPSAKSINLLSDIKNFKVQPFFFYPSDFPTPSVNTNFMSCIHKVLLLSFMYQLPQPSIIHQPSYPIIHLSMDCTYGSFCNVALELVLLVFWFAVCAYLAPHSVLTSTSPRKLHRQGSIYQRGHMIRQSTLPSPPEDTLYESSCESREAENGEAGGYSGQLTNMSAHDQLRHSYIK